VKVALVCPTIGQTQRGYERYFSELFEAIKDDIDITLFKGAGPQKERERVIPHFTRTGVLKRICGNRARYPRYHLEFASFAAAFFPFLALGKFELVHFVDPPLARWLALTRRCMRKQFGLVFSDAGPISYDSSKWVDHIHCLSPDAMIESRAAKVPPERLTLLPIGVNSNRVVTPLGRLELRRKYSIPENTFVILSVTTLNRTHKRVDYLIEEAAKAEGDFILWIDGGFHPDGDPSLLDLAALRLGNRHRYTHVPSDRVSELFKLADVMVSTSLRESFGMAIVESLCSGLPVIAHDSSHFRWLLGDAGNLVDMSRSGNLASRISRFVQNPSELTRPRSDSDIAKRFGWHALKTGYLDMYKQCATFGRHL
jgi:glycosyltransferase involved in cell wall biosynthesis